MSSDGSRPSFGLALASVLLAGGLSLALSSAVVGPEAESRTLWHLLAGLAAAFVVKLVVRLGGYQVPYVTALVAVLAGDVTAIALLKGIPGVIDPLLPSTSAVNALAVLPSLVLSSLIVWLGASPRAGA